MGDSSSAEDGSNEVLEVSPPIVNQVVENQCVNNDRELSTTTTNNNNGTNNENEFSNQQRRNINAHTTNFGSQNSNASQQMQFGGFLDTTGCNIRLNAYATALTGLLQLANGNENGIVAAIGYNNRSNWISQNIDAFFEPGGPLDSFQPVSTEVLQWHLKRAETLACSFYNLHHSRLGGEEHEDIPDWAGSFFQYFEALSNHQTPNQRALNVRNERNQVVASIIGQQVPLGATGADGPVHLQNEVAQNNGSPAQRRQVVGNVMMERVNLQEGRDDVYERSSAPRRRLHNGACHRNVHIARFSPNNNDQST